MSKYQNLTIIGTSHIARESVNKVIKEFKRINPEIVALELDAPRLKGLLSNKRGKLTGLRELGFFGFLINLVGSYFEKVLGKITGISPGTEMKTAYRLALKNNAKIALIDQPINITLKRLTSQITRKEKISLLKEFLFFPFMRKKQIIFDLNKVPSQEIINKLMKETKKNYPTVYRILVTERNNVMAKNLYKLITLYPDKKIMAIIGAGHEKEIICQIKSIKNSKQ